MHIDLRDLPDVFNRWLSSIAQLITGSAAASLKNSSIKPGSGRAGYKQRKEQLLQRIADNEVVRSVLLKHRAKLLEQLQQSRSITTDIRLGESLTKALETKDGSASTSARSLLIAPTVTVPLAPEAFSMPSEESEVELDGEVDQDISADQVSEVLDTDEDGDAIVMQNDRVQIRERTGRGIERVTTQVSSKVYEGSLLIAKSDHVSRLDMDAGNIVKVRFSDGSLHDAVFSGKFAKPDAANKSRTGIPSSSIQTSIPSLPHKKLGTSSHENSAGSSSASPNVNFPPRPIIYFPGSTPFAVSAESLVANVTKKISMDGSSHLFNEAPQMPRIVADFRRTTGAL